MKVKKRDIEKKDRNEKLLVDYNEGMLIRKIMDKYSISKARVYQILNRFEEE